MNDPIIDDIAGTITDPDGRAEREAMAPFVGIIGNSTRAYAWLTLNIACQTTASTLINNGTELFIEIRVKQGQAIHRRTHRIALGLAGATVGLLPGTGVTWVALSTEETVKIEARLIDAADTPQGCNGPCQKNQA
jgi:hypothetical protein